MYLTDADFADDIALISGCLENTQALLKSLELAANCIGLYLNETKTEYLFKSPSNSNDSFAMKTLNSNTINRTNDYKYLGSYISSSEKDFNVRKGMAWSACNDLHKIWASDLNVELKVQFFRAFVEPILLYGSETWILSRKIEKSLDGTYTRLLTRVKKSFLEISFN